MSTNWMEMKVKVGDRFRYHDRGTPSRQHIGKQGTITSVASSSHVEVKFDGDGTVTSISKANIDILPMNEVDAAIALLKQHGTVTFVPTFKPVTVYLNGEYNAIVHEDHVKVGCQQFRFDKVLELAETVQKVKAQLKQ